MLPGMHDTSGTRPLTPPLHWGDPPLANTRLDEPDLLLPVGTVSLLLADIAGSSRLWEASADSMAAGLARLDEIVAEACGRHGGVRPVEQGEGDSFLAAFARASDAVACALELQRADTGAIRLRIGVHTGEVQLRDEGNYMGATVNRAARLRDLAHGGQTVLSQVTRDLVVDRLPEGAWLVDLGSHRLRDLTRAEGVHQLCHANLDAAFPALRSLDAHPHNLPVQLTSFVGRAAELADVLRLLGETRMLALVGSGGCGKTRLALQVAADTLAGYPDGAWFVDFAPLTEPDTVASTVARSLGLADEQARTPLETLAHHIGAQQMLLVLDNCEHLIAACATVAESLLVRCPSLAVLATSREPLGVPGEIAWRVPSLSLPVDAGSRQVAALAQSDAVQLFVDRARRARPAFELDAGPAAVGDICRRLDGIPLAIELAAARVRVLSVEQISEGLNDCFRLLAGGARTAVPRQQTLRASVEWSHELLTAPERVLLRRLAVFLDTFDLEAAEAVGQGEGLERHNVLDQLTLLVDKSLVVAVDTKEATRYRLLETVRQYAAEHLARSGDADAVRLRHRDHLIGFAATASAGTQGPDQMAWFDHLEASMGDMRAAFLFSCGRGDADEALRLAVLLFPVWLIRGRWIEGRAWVEEGLAVGTEVDPALRAAAVTILWYLWGLAGTAALPLIEDPVEPARAIGDKRLLARALLATSRPFILAHDRIAGPLRESIDLAREAGDTWTLIGALTSLGFASATAGDSSGRALLDEARSLAAELGDGFRRRLATHMLCFVMSGIEGDLRPARVLADALLREARACSGRNEIAMADVLVAYTAAWLGDLDVAREAAEEALAIGLDIAAPTAVSSAFATLGMSALAAGDVAAARERLQLAFAEPTMPRFIDAFCGWRIDAELLSGDVAAARRLADEAVAVTETTRARCFHAFAVLSSARVTVAESDPQRAEDLAHSALADLAMVGNRGYLADTIELLVALAAGQDSRAEAARLAGAADAIRRSTGYVRFLAYEKWYLRVVRSLKDEMGEKQFDAAFAAGAALSVDDAVAYARRGRGERRRPATGWGSLTPSEVSVARLVADGLANKEIAQRLFISPRTVQAHLSHIFTKLDVVSRVQLAKEASRQAGPSAS